MGLSPFPGLWLELWEVFGKELPRSETAESRES